MYDPRMRPFSPRRAGPQLVETSYTTRETFVDVGPVKVTADNLKDLPLSSILGGIALAGGVGFIVVGARKP